ncbi:TPA: hypothetical protein ACKPX6_001127 [Serratia marcescens]
MGNMISVNNISELRNLTPATDDQIVFLVSHSTGRFAGGGEFYYAKTDTTSTDNNGTVVVTADGARWKRLTLSLPSITSAPIPVALSPLTRQSARH